VVGIEFPKTGPNAIDVVNVVAMLGDLRISTAGVDDVDVNNMFALRVAGSDVVDRPFAHEMILSLLQSLYSQPLRACQNIIMRQKLRPYFTNSNGSRKPLTIVSVVYAISLVSFFF
jgi:hypothetical protein